MIKPLQKFLLIVFFTPVLYTSAQKPASPAKQPVSFKYGKLDVADFNIRPSGDDSSASAVVLFDVGSSEFVINNASGEFAISFERHKRVKIMTKEGYEYADFSVPYYKSNNGEEKVQGLSATAYNLENGKIVATKMTSDAKFNEKVNKNWSRLKFTIPQVKEGTIIEYRYKIVSDFLFNLREWHFQGELPVLYTDYKVSIPEYFNYKSFNNIYIDEITQMPAQMALKNFSGSYSEGAGVPQHFSVNANCNVYRWVGKNIDAFKEEAYTTTPDDYLQKIEFELMSIKYPEAKLINYTTTWDKIVERLDEDESFGLFIKADKSSTALSNMILAGTTSAPEKMNKIFSYLKRTVKWNEQNRMYTDAKHAKAVIDQKKGSSADINLTLIKLLKSAGLDSYPVLISTRDNGVHPGYPMLTKFNYVIAAVKIDSAVHLLDATNQHNGINILPFQCLNHKGLALNMKGRMADWISLERKQPSAKSIFYNLDMNTDGTLSGKIVIRRQDVLAKLLREEVEKAGSEEEFLKEYKKDKNGLNIKSHKLINMDNPDEALIEEYEVMMEEAFDEVGPNLFLTPTFFEKTNENPFKLDERKFPVDFAFPTTENFRLTLTLPDGVNVDKLPKSLKVKLPDESAFFEYRVSAEGRVISVQSKITVQRSLYNPEEYHDIKELFKNIVSKQAEQIVLKKS